MADSHATHHVNYFYVFVALCVFTAISAGTELITFPNYASLVVAVFAVATAKALCVMAFFMHLKFEGNWKYLLLAPTAILALGLPLALLPDIGLPYYMRDTTQLDEYHATEGAHAEEHGDAPAHGGH